VSEGSGGAGGRRPATRFLANARNDSRLCALIVLLIAASATADRIHGRLPLESVTSSQGLPSDSISNIVTDSRGYLWFGTLDGLSRYDGNRFVNYTIDDGLPDRQVWSIVEDRSGAMWIGTTQGAAVMKPNASRGRELFTRIGSKAETVDASTIFIDSHGAVWSQCNGDLCAIANGRFHVDESFRRAGGRNVRSISETPDGDLWIGTEFGLMRRSRDGAWRHYDAQPHLDADPIFAACDRAGRVWIATGFGMIVFAPGNDESDSRSLAARAGKPLLPGMSLRLPNRGEAIAITVESPSPIIHPTQPFFARDGVVWIPAYVGLFRAGDGRLDFFDAKDGLPPLEITAVGEDPSGALWIGTRGAGALRLALSGATTFNRTHGLANERIMSIFELGDGTVCASDRKGLTCFDTRGAIRHASLWPRNNRFQGWGWNQIVVRDADDSIWFTTAEGLVHWPRVARIEDLGRIDPLAVYTTRDGFDSDDLFRVWRDSRGDLFVGTFGHKPLSIAKSGSTRFESFGADKGFMYAAPSAFAEDRAGNVWIGVYVGGLFRYANGRFERITEHIPPGFVRDLKIDSKGRLWIATMIGVARIDNPTAPARDFVIKHFSRRDGLASDTAYCFAELPDGRMAIGSQRGLDVLDPVSGKVVHLSMREGLASNEVSVAMCDRSGALWLGTVNGLSRLSSIPAPHIAGAPARVHIESIDIDGVATPVAELGVSRVSDLRIEYPHHTMAVRFSAPNYDSAHPLRFDYRLGANAKWIDAGLQRAIVFEHLPSGRGAFEVRAVTPNGIASDPAQIAFVVVPPLWRRPWFITLVAIAVAALAVLAHRARVAHLVALERVRTRVATDLHDDLGTTLSRISILSEAAKRKSDPAPILDEIADSARGLVEALGDSIWSIDPRRDDVQSLVARARHFASGVFESQSIAIDVELPPNVASIPLRPEQRRETYLILKEALNNAAKHAHATHVAVVASAEDRMLRIAVKDDGRGFAPQNGERENGGRGVPSMIDRAKRVGGTLDIESTPGAGTRVSLALPL
jgi:signal transduction histidine kinase/ligand-binding sensor domain-containing protein